MDSTEITKILELAERPAFCVSGDMITAVNSAAAAKQIAPGLELSRFLTSGQEEYQSLDQGRLCLSVTFHSTVFGAEVRRMDGWDLFLLEPQYSDPELQALSLAARELRGPLDRLLTGTEQLSRKMGDGNADPEFAQLNRALYQLQRLVCNMSDAGARSAPLLELQDVTALAQELFDQARELCAAANVTLEFVNLPVPAYATVDRDRLERGIYNILSNSMKFSAPGSVIRASLTRRMNTLYFTITDAGSGLGGSSAPDLFSRFLREPDIEDSRHGIGLGLTLVRSAAMAHGGTMMVSPAETGGTRTILTIPIRQNSNLRCHPLRIDYAGERNHGLIELSEVLPPELYSPENL